MHESVREIFDAGQRAATLTRQLLAFSRKQVITPKLVNLNTVVTDLVKMLRRLVVKTSRSSPPSNRRSNPYSWMRDKWNRYS
jgi:hypothetical protein